MNEVISPKGNKTFFSMETLISHIYKTLQYLIILTEHFAVRLAVFPRVSKVGIGGCCFQPPIPWNQLSETATLSTFNFKPKIFCFVIAFTWGLIRWPRTIRWLWCNKLRMPGDALNLLHRSLFTVCLSTTAASVKKMICAVLSFLHWLQQFMFSYLFSFVWQAVSIQHITFFECSDNKIFSR